MKNSKVDALSRFRCLFTIPEILENDLSIILDEVGISIKRKTKADKIGNEDD